MEDQEQDTRGFRQRYREENKCIFDKRTDGLCYRLLGAASQASEAYQSKRKRIFSQRELDLFRKETVDAFYKNAAKEISNAKNEVAESLKSHQTEIQQLFSVKPGELAQAAHERELLRARIRAASTKELKEEAKAFIRNGATGFEIERVNMLAGELRNRADHETADQIRFADSQKWHVTEPWLNTQTYQVIQMEEEDVQTVANAFEAGSVYGVIDGKLVNKSLDHYFPPKLESSQ
jgi:hypothetical protein